MASNFHIIYYKNRNSLHLRLSGDFDVISAQELTNTLLIHGGGYSDIFIDTNNLETIHPLGSVTFKMNFSNFKKQLNNIFFIGANKYKIAPN